MNKKISLVSLGCAKNLVNSEQMLYLLNEAGYELTESIADSDGIIINTCGFIDAAKSEAIDTILSVAELKNSNPDFKIIVSGCLTERYREEVTKELPEIDAITGVGNFSQIVDIVNDVFRGKSPMVFGDNNAPIEETPRIISTGPSWAYLRIAEGCNNYCAFCAIPFIRGRYRSRDIDSIISEATQLANDGVKELIVIAQDITRYGMDLYGHPSLTELCRRLSVIPGIEWIRLHYLYPEMIDDELIDEIANNAKILKYLDIPIQHINDSILKKMNRHTDGKQIRALIHKLRDGIPNLVLRTSIITGLPGESDDEFEELCSFLKETRIERAGVFPFSPEEGTPAVNMEHVDYETAKKRADIIMGLQCRIMDEFYQSLIGQRIDVLVESYNEDEQLWIGRSYMDSPDIDGLVCFRGDASPGMICSVILEDEDNGILFGYKYHSDI